MEAQPTKYHMEVKTTKYHMKAKKKDWIVIGNTQIGYTAPKTWQHQKTHTSYLSRTPRTTCKISKIERKKMCIWPL